MQPVPHPRSSRNPARGSIWVFAGFVFLGTLALVLAFALFLRATPSGEEPTGQASTPEEPHPSAGPDLLASSGGKSGPRSPVPDRPPADPGQADEPGLPDPDPDADTVAERIGAANPRTITPGLERTLFEERLIDVYRHSRRSVVHVTSAWSMRAVGSSARASVPVGTGSGFVWDENGYIVTSYATVPGVDAAWVRLADGSTWRAVLVGDAREYDIALLYIDAPRNFLRPVALGSARGLEAGQAVIALGNPSGDEVLFFSGHVAGRDQVLGSSSTGRTLRGVILTDLELTRGMSGGPLLDSGGRLVGLRVSVAAGGSSSFAIPVELVNQVVPRIIREGHVPWPELGLLFAPATTAEHLGVEGLVVIEVVEDGPSARAGLRSIVFESPGRPRSFDLVVGIDGRAVRNRFDVDEALLEHEPGELVAIDVMRGDETLRFFVPLE